jgi:hypothetical protein
MYNKRVIQYITFLSTITNNDFIIIIIIFNVNRLNSMNYIVGHFSIHLLSNN